MVGFSCAAALVLCRSWVIRVITAQIQLTHHRVDSLVAPSRYGRNGSASRTASRRTHAQPPWTRHATTVAHASFAVDIPSSAVNIVPAPHADAASLSLAACRRVERRSSSAALFSADGVAAAWVSATCSSHRPVHAAQRSSSPGAHRRDPLRHCHALRGVHHHLRRAHRPPDHECSRGGRRHRQRLPLGQQRARGHK